MQKTTNFLWSWPRNLDNVWTVAKWSGTFLASKPKIIQAKIGLLRILCRLGALLWVGVFRFWGQMLTWVTRPRDIAGNVPYEVVLIRILCYLSLFVHLNAIIKVIQSPNSMWPLVMFSHVLSHVTVHSFTSFYMFVPWLRVLLKSRSSTFSPVELLRMHMTKWRPVRWFFALVRQ